MLKRMIKILFLGLIGAFIVIYFFGSRPLQKTMKENAKRAESALQEAQKYAPIITYEDYKQINNGMSYRHTCLIIGFAGKESARNSIDAIPGVMDSVETIVYEWHNNDGSNINVVFQNDKLIQKAQYGLN